jgi:hypothetical protein
MKLCTLEEDNPQLGQVTADDRARATILTCPATCSTRSNSTPAR